jgi:hypothetical protein
MFIVNEVEHSENSLIVCFAHLSTRLSLETALVRSQQAYRSPILQLHQFLNIPFSYLDSSTGSKVEHTLVKVLIEAHIARIHDEFKPMVEHEKIGDLKRVFALVNRADKFRSEADKSNNVSPFLGTIFYVKNLGSTGIRNHMGGHG